MPMHVDAQDVERIQTALGCRVEGFP
jgi:hypothetical protein